MYVYTYMSHELEISYELRRDMASYVLVRDS